MFISSICPVCNGLQAIREICGCGSPYEDRGRLGDAYGPYAPYRAIDDLKLTDGYPDLAESTCIHLLCCPACGAESVQAVAERPIPPEGD